MAGLFRFPDEFADARVEELKLLSAATQSDTLYVAPVPPGAWHDLLVSLVSDDLLSAFSYDERRRMAANRNDPNPNLAVGAGIAGETVLERSMVISRVTTLKALYEMQPVLLRVTHKGRVRLSELKQVLRTGREREPFGILWDGRHWEQDLQIAVFDARPDAPLAVAYLDMNGLKQVNDKRGHDAGDLALKTYFQAVASVLGDRGQAYRLGGDEVLVTLPNHNKEAAAKLLGAACRKLMNERFEPPGPTNLSIAAGIIATSAATASPTDLRARADQVQYLAKERSRQEATRPSVIAIEGTDKLIILPAT
jgi:diguanylate cyclase (GGDEF)-like protein